MNIIMNQHHQSPQQRWGCLLFLLLQLHIHVGADGGDVKQGRYSSIFSFGDSITDTGNSYFISAELTPNCLIPPYGETYFHHPSGRCSDGRIITDFIADYMGIPHLRPYLAFKNGAVPRGSIQHGLNFAIAGATALNRTFFEDKGFVVDATTSYSLMVQLDWFKELLPSLCTSPSSCKQVLSSSLFIVGEIGVNDYGYLLEETTELQMLTPYIHQVVSVITSVIRELINLGAVTLMVPGSIPLGCNPAYLTLLASPNKEEYDKAGCLKWLNKFYGQHNELLQIELDRLRVLYPHVNIIYADYFNAALRFYRSPQQFGFCRDFIKVCCGGGGPYNFNETAVCGEAGAIACDDPSEYIYWDGYHFTEAAYRWMAKALFHGPYTFPKFSFSCITPETSADFNNHLMI
ncbi:GDSL esterase/lipase At1g28600 [Arachis duranensis]|uniref:GDSL esterase/lipase At1g28600 n=1 Tax=Arachis duranensis TaxID=130453 RepID=A0A6P4C4F9_ARADU|nr:GDSL esterase/lipase At1g28600 [Arachis duranensis]XP_025621882.1 GDSL esterase/lipase At1g28600 [Arachis hypogaea]QHO14737.1 GDSL esterase/lipase [Arachis hypogaea]